MTDRSDSVPFQNLYSMERRIRFLGGLTFGDDLFQEVALKVLRTGSVPGSDRVLSKAYIWAVAHTTLSDLRRRNRRNSMHDETDFEQLPDRSSSAVPHAAIERREDHEQLHKAVDSLPAIYARAILDELNGDAGRHNQHVPIETLRTRKKRARKMLRDRLGPSWPTANDNPMRKSKSDQTVIRVRPRY